MFRGKIHLFTLLAALVAVAIATPVSKTTSKHGTSAHQPTIKSPLGNIQGSILTSRLGKTIYAFRGIKFAKAPVNELRFQAPVPAEKWEGSYNATENAASCPQPDVENTSEDCLHLNVYSTKLPKGTESPKRPVIVFFHYGGLYKFSASSDILGPQYLLDQDVVLVTPNYRLGSLGFLSTGDKDAPGNNGFKDQVAALQWVHDNIAAFGGDPTLVTIAGYSAGGLSVTLHLVSPMSKGLFHRAIAMSGSALGGHVPIVAAGSESVGGPMALAKKQARLVNCPDDTASNIIKCLRGKSAEDLGQSLAGFKDYGKDPVWIWHPVIEADHGQPRFLTAHPLETLESGDFNKVPVLLGVTSDEMGYKAFDVINNATLLELVNKDFDTVSPALFDYEQSTDDSKTASKHIKNFYFGDKPLDNSSLSSLAQLYSDALIGFSVNRAAKIISEKLTGEVEDVFYYLFNLKSETSTFYLPGTTVPYGVVHADDLMYLFQAKEAIQFKEDSTELNTLKKITIMWKNFAKLGKPTGENGDELDKVNWESFEVDTQKYLDISNKLVVHDKLNEKRYSEWEKWFPLTKYEKVQSG